MSLLGHIEKIRRRPVAERKRLLIIWTVSGTLIIALIWLVNILILLPGADYNRLVSDGQRSGFISRQFDRTYAGFTVIKNGIEELF